MPDFDFAVRLRSTSTCPIQPRAVLVVEGLFALAIEHVVESAALRVFVVHPDMSGTSEGTQRDVATRGRSPESVHDQWVKTVCPGHRSVVEPQRRHANLIVNEASPASGMLAAIIEEIDAIGLKHPVSGLR